MRQVFVTASGILVEDVPAPPCLPGGVLVQNHFSVISAGTETSSLRTSSRGIARSVLGPAAKVAGLGGKTMAKLKSEGLNATLRAIRHRYPNLEPLGYSCAGAVVQTGEGVRTLNAGDLVACAGSGYANHAELVWVPENLACPVPPAVDAQDAAYVALGSIAMHGIRRSGGTFGERILVVGLGLLGLLGVQIARSAGLRVVGFDPDTARAKLAKSLGAEETYSDAGKLEKSIGRLTGGNGFDASVVFAASKSAGPVDLAMKSCRKRGRVVIVGDVGLDLKRELMYKNELDVVMATSYGPGRYDPMYEERGHDYPVGYVRWTEKRNMEEFLALVREKKVDVRRLTAMVVDVQRATHAYRALAQGTNRPLGVVLRYPEGEISYKRVTRVNSATGPAPLQGKIGIAVLGAGGFARSTHIPNILAHPECELRAVVTLAGGEARTLAAKLGVEYASTDASEMLALKGIDAVVIATRHHLHAEQVIQCVESGKHVLVEKPLALTEAELRKVATVAGKSGRIVTVGFNRRYAPMIRALKAATEASSPVMINYRINAGPIPPDHWTQDPAVGGGRIVGEVCHFVDTCSFLAGSRVSDVHAISVPVGKGPVVAPDNVAVLLKFENGSVASLLYTALGDASMPKERLEWFQDSRAAVLDDYRELHWYGGGQDQILKSQEKGHREELARFLLAIRGQAGELVTLEEAIEVTRTTFKIRDLMRGGC